MGGAGGRRPRVAGNGGHRAARHEAIVGVMDACGLAGLSNLAIGTSTDGTRED